jgi:hypothetical protein
VRLCLIAATSREAEIGVYATSPAWRFFTVLYGVAARSAMRGLFPGGLGGCPVGAGSDMTAQTVPAGCLMLTCALISPAFPLTCMLLDATSAGFFREIFTFTAVLTGLVLAMWTALYRYERRSVANLHEVTQDAPFRPSSPCGGTHSGQRLKCGRTGFLPGHGKRHGNLANSDYAMCVNRPTSDLDAMHHGSRLETWKEWI